jgi:trehalose 6-phosphate phosphatase
MKHLFSREGQQAIDTVMAGHPLLAFDFDGTLAPIVARPDDAQVPLSLRLRLGQLAEVLPTAVVTGRSVADVRHRLGFEPRCIIGNHGAEPPADWQATQAATDWLAALEPARALLTEHRAALDQAGVQLEDKGQSLALHHRLAPDQAGALSLIRALTLALPDGLRTFGGKCVVNIVSVTAPDKGDAVNHLALRLGCRQGVFIGDDVNDEPVFEKVPADWLTVRIGRDHPTSSARFFLDSHVEMAPLLQELLNALSRHRAPAHAQPAPPPAGQGQG